MMSIIQQVQQHEWFGAKNTVKARRALGERRSAPRTTVDSSMACKAAAATTFIRLGINMLNADLRQAPVPRPLWS